MTVHVGWREFIGVSQVSNPAMLNPILLDGVQRDFRRYVARRPQCRFGAVTYEMVDRPEFDVRRCMWHAESVLVWS
jgi:hypothetical protein